MRTGQTSAEGEMRLELTRRGLARAKKKALRQRCWHKALSRLERGILDLTIRCVEEVKSGRLRAALAKILAKLMQALRPGYIDIVEMMGRPLAARISQLAQSWGNREAAEWKDDAALTRYLGASKLDRSGQSSSVRQPRARTTV